MPAFSKLIVVAATLAALTTSADAARDRRENRVRRKAEVAATNARLAHDEAYHADSVAEDLLERASRTCGHGFEYNTEESTCVLIPNEGRPRVNAPPLVGIAPGVERPKLIVAQDIDWPPYAFLGVPPESDYTVAGIGHDIAMGLEEVCDIDVTVVQTNWADCWTNNMIGDKLDAGRYHGCLTYTHTLGSRPRYMDFSYGFLKDNKPAGLLVRLDPVTGEPSVSPGSDLSGVTVVDVGGWAPTSDGLKVVTNQCTGQAFADDVNIIVPEDDGNDAAMKMLRDGDADAMWVYADQAHNYDCSNPDVSPDWDCSLWEGFGTEFAYIHTGLFGHAINGTTLTISKKGSGLNDLVNPCLQAFMETESYFEVCQKHGLEGSCYPNEFFGEGSDTTEPWELNTDEQSASCSDGYCGCPAPLP